jgi:hypothetical protein
MLLAGLSTRNKKQKNLGTMKGWKKSLPLVKFESDATLNQVRDELVAGGNVLQDLLVAVHPDAGAVLTAVESITSQLDEEGISKTWVTAHVRVGRETELIANTDVRQVSLSIFFYLSNMLTSMCSNYLLCSGSIAGISQLRASVVFVLH